MELVEVKVNRFKSGYSCKIYRKGILIDEWLVNNQKEIGPVCRNLLRWYDKLYGDSKYADRGRFRAWGKADCCTDANDKRLREKDMSLFEIKFKIKRS